MTDENKAIADGPNPDYDPRIDAIDAIADHLQSDDSAYEERHIAEEQARRIIEAIDRRGLTITLAERDNG